MEMCRRVLQACLVLLILVVPTAPLRAVEPGEILKDPALETRARKISANLRCLVCQNQSIDDSNAPLARDLRVLVRDRLKIGDTDDQVIAYVVARYGEFVLLRPRFGLHTLVLWLSPLAILSFSVLLMFMSWRRKKAEAGDAADLSTQEKRKLKKLLEADET